MKSQVTTGQGDQGQTRGISGDTVSKAHPIMDCVGCVDELRAHTALLRQMVLEAQPNDFVRVADLLQWIMHLYFVMGTECSDPERKKPEYRQAEINPNHLDQMEEEQQRLEAEAPLPHSFIVGASNPIAAQADICVTVARRLEREIVRLKEAVPAFDTTHLLPLVNRLNDTLFVLARYLEDGDHDVVDYSVLAR